MSPQFRHALLLLLAPLSVQCAPLASTTTTPPISASTVNPTTEVGGVGPGPHGNTAVPPVHTFKNPPLLQQFEFGGPPQPIRGDEAGAFILAPLSAAAPLASTATTPPASTSTVNPSTEVGGTTPGPHGNTAVPPSETVAPAPEFINPPLLQQFESGGPPQPIRGDGAGAWILGPANVPFERQNPDLLVSPSTDAGTVCVTPFDVILIDNSDKFVSISQGQLKMDCSKNSYSNRVQIGGWARQQNINDMPIATELAGVNMRLRANAYRELHWHTAAEWAYMIAGSARINAVDQNGKAYAANIYPGDLWYFPAGIPHSIQGLDDIADGCEFLLVFDKGDASEDNTFLVTDWLAHVPKEVIARNFKVAQSALKKLPSRQLWIFPGNNSESLEDDLKIVREAGEVPEPFSFAASKMNATEKDGGTVKIVDSSIFTASKTIAFADVTIEPGAMRELHWHPTQAEWSFFLSGSARLTSYAASGNARTFDYTAGDVAYIPPSFGHYIENIGNDTVHYLEIFKTDKFGDVSLSQWLAFTPPQIVKSTLGVDDDFLSHLSKVKPIVVGPA